MSSGPARVGGSGASGAASWWPLVVIAAAMATAGFVWLTAGLAGLLLGAGWPTGGLGQSGLVLRHLPANMADPRRAWPARAQAGLPGPVGFYAVASVLLVLVAAVAVAVRQSRHREQPAGRARWATKRDLRPLVVDEDPATRPGRIALGRADLVRRRQLRLQLSRTS